MKITNWICWLLLAYVCLAEARYKIRRPPLPPPQPLKMIYKKPWPISHRISTGNTMHMSGSFPPKRIPQKLPNYRIRRPVMFNVNMAPNIWKNPMPIRASINNHAVLPQRPPVREFHTVNKMPEYNSEYRPEPAVLPPTHRGGMDDDKGPIHTIPAPNLSPMDKPFSSESNTEESSQRHQTMDGTYKIHPHGGLLPNFDLATIGTSLAPQRTATVATPTQHHYEVTESNEVSQKDYQTVLPTFFPPEYATLSTLVNPELQTNDVYLNNQAASNFGLIGTNIQLGQPNVPMQTNLHSSLHVGFPGTAGQTPYIINQQIPDLHVGHPAPAGPPLSATQLYDLLNSFPQKVPDQYQAGQQPQLQQHILQQQLSQLFQPTGVTGFSQPQMQSFNYDEQDNKEQQQQQQQQQQLLYNQDYIAGRVNTNYNVVSETSVDEQANNNLQDNQDLGYIADGNEQLENKIEYEENDTQKGQTTYYNKVANNDGISSQFYTTLPNREAAEKLAALAAAGNVNSQLIGQLRKQQQQQRQQNVQEGDTMPLNHKNEEYKTNEQINEDNGYNQNYHQDRVQNKQTQRQSQREQQLQQSEYERQREQLEYEKQNDYERQRVQHRERQNVYSNKRPLRIMVPDANDYSNTEPQNDEGKENMEFEYEYENDDADIANSQSDNNSFNGRTSFEQSNGEFGSRLTSKAAF